MYYQFKYSTQLFFCIFFLAISFIIINSIKVGAAGANTIYLTPESLNVTQGNIFSISVRADASSGNAAQIDINYPSTSLEVVSYSKNLGIFENEFALTNTPGVFKLSLYDTPTQGGISSDSLLLTITFRAKQSSGTAKIDLLNSSLVVLSPSTTANAGSDSIVSFNPVKYPSGMIVKDGNGNYYYTYYVPGSNYIGPKLKYIGKPEVLNYYLNRGRKVYKISDSVKSSFTVHNNNLTFPCGESVRDNSGRLAFLEPIGVTPGAQDQADPIFSYAENFPQYVPYVDWNGPNTSLHYQNILKLKKFNQTSVIDGLPNGVTGGIYPYGIPNCVIVKQVNSQNYYRVFRHLTSSGASVQRKAIIGNTDLLKLWLNFNSYTYETDITSLSSIGSVKIPPGLLVKSNLNSSVFYIDDEGNKIYIPSIEIFNSLGFSANDIVTVQQATLNTTPTKNIY